MVSFVEREKIKTTEVKAKELRPFIEKIITRSKKDSVFTRKLLVSKLGGGTSLTAKKLVEVIAPKYKNRPGGYVRITKLTPRKGDGSKMAQIELVQ